MRRFAAALSVAALLATGGSAARPAHASRQPDTTRPASLCDGGERVVYSCRFGAKIGSVCVGRNTLHYRFGRQGHAEIDVASAPDWSNIHQGGNRSQGGDNQDSIRFTNGLTHYVVHQDEAGSLNETPGRTFSGIEVLRGSKGEQSIASLSCKTRSRFNWQAFDAIGDAAPKDWDGAETPGGPFDMVY